MEDLLDEVAHLHGLKKPIGLQQRRAFPKLTRCLKQVFPNANIYFYGSRVMGVATDESDIDVYIEIDDSYFEGLDNDEVEVHLDSLKHVMNVQQKDIWDVKYWLNNSRVPLIRAIFKPYGIECDITFSSGLGVENTELLRHLFTIQPEAMKLVVFMKKWLKMNGVCLKGYIITLLCIFFLQKRNFLPSIKLVQSQEDVVEIQGYEVQFDENLDLDDYDIDLIDDFRDVVDDFFEFWEDFDFEDTIISLYMGCECVKNRGRQWQRSMSLPAPLMSSVNLAYNVGRKTLTKFRRLCAET